MNEFEKIAFHPILLERLLLKPLRSLIAKRVEGQGTRSREDATSEALPLVSDQLESRYPLSNPVCGRLLIIETTLSLLTNNNRVIHRHNHID